MHFLACDCAPAAGLSFKLLFAKVCMANAVRLPLQPVLCGRGRGMVNCDFVVVVVVFGQIAFDG